MADREAVEQSGPWSIERADGDIVILDADGGIAHVWRGPKAERVARLIAAAPDLLEAAKRALAVLGTYTTYEDEATELRAAIQRTEGGSDART